MSQQGPNKAISKAPAGSNLLIPIFGVPLAIHAITGAVVATLTVAAGKILFTKAAARLKATRTPTDSQATDTLAQSDGTTEPDDQHT